MGHRDLEVEAAQDLFLHFKNVGGPDSLGYRQPGTHMEVALLEFGSDTQCRGPQRVVLLHWQTPPSQEPVDRPDRQMECFRFELRLGM